MSTRFWAEDLLHFWFNKLTPSERFGRSDAVDAELRRRYGRWLEVLGNRPPSDFLGDPDTARAAILLFDQCPRNLLRGSPQAYTYDPLARAICHAALREKWDRGLTKPERQFLYMPLMHSEHIMDQQLSMRLYTRLGDSFIRGFARDHYAMIARFGRFPHRNQVLGRGSTPAEERAVASGHSW